VAGQGQFGFRNLQASSAFGTDSSFLRYDTIVIIDTATHDTTKKLEAVYKYFPANRVNRYHIAGAPSNLSVWDVTDFHNVKSVSLTPNQ